MNTAYPYQEVGINQMFSRPGFLLADDMGLGKTVTALLELKRYQPRTVLIVAPKTAVGVWESHIKSWLPERTPRVLVGPPQDRRRVWREYQAMGGIVITTWGLLAKVPELFQERWGFIIADEAHYIKNRKAKRSVLLKRLQGEYKRALTGTPVINTPDELWSILNWLYPKTYTSFWRFFEKYVAYEVDYFGYRQVLGPKRVTELQREIGPFFLQRKKADVLTDLPDKYQTVINLELSSKQKKAYNEIKKKKVTRLDDGFVLDSPTVLAKLTRMRQLTVAYAEANAAGDGMVMTEPSSKLDAVMEIVNGTDKPIVVFSKFRQAIDLLMKRCQTEGISADRLVGSQSATERSRVVEHFQNGKLRVLGATISAGGVGITLTAADTCIFIDRAWSPAENNQAEDRLHRIGQKNAVNVIILQIPGTTDDDIDGTLWRKWEWVKKMLGE